MSTIPPPISVVDLRVLPPPPPPPMVVGDPARRYRPAATLAGWLQGVFVAVALLDLVAVVLFRRSVDDLVPAPTLDAVDLATLIVMGAGAVLFLVWSHRVAANAQALGALDLDVTPRSAVWWWFVPFANMVQPPRMLNQVAKASRPEPAYRSRDWRQAPALPLIAAWWAAWLVSRVLSRIVVGSDLTIDSFWVSGVGIGVLVGVEVLALGLAVAVVGRITSMQRQRAVRLARTGHLPPELSEHAVT